MNDAEFATGDFEAIESMVKLFQDTSMNLRYSQIPTVSAVQGFAFGGGCEFVMHSNKVVAALESYVGLVEVGVGPILPAAAPKDFALQAARASQGDLLAALKDRYMNLAMAKVATSAIEAKELGFMRESDAVVFNSYELLHVALNEARAMADSGFRPDVPALLPRGRPQRRRLDSRSAFKHERRRLYQRIRYAHRQPNRLGDYRRRRRPRHRGRRAMAA